MNQLSNDNLCAIQKALFSTVQGVQKRTKTRFSSQEAWLQSPRGDKIELYEVNDKRKYIVI